MRSKAEIERIRTILELNVDIRYRRFLENMRVGDEADVTGLKTMRLAQFRHAHLFRALPTFVATRYRLEQGDLHEARLNPQVHFCAAPSARIKRERDAACRVVRASR